MVNKRSWLLRRAFQINFSYEFILRQEIADVFDKGGWKNFYEKYADVNGIYEIAAVGFNADKTVAVASVNHTCGLACAEGEFYVLEKKAGKWQPLEWKGQKCWWVS